MQVAFVHSIWKCPAAAHQEVPGGGGGLPTPTPRNFLVGNSRALPDGVDKSHLHGKKLNNVMYCFKVGVFFFLGWGSLNANI